MSDERLTRLEEKLAFLEQHVSELDGLVLELNRENAQLKDQLRVTQQRMQALADAQPDTPRSLEDDKPPHW